MKIERKKEIFVFASAFAVLVFSYLLFNFHYSFNHDTWHYAFTTYRIIQEQIKNGIFPFWNNYEGLGMPLIFKGGIDLIFTPLLFVLSAREHLAIVGFIYFLLGIYFFYLLIRDEGIDKSVALAGGIVWGTNGYFLWHLHELGIQSVCTYIPLVLLTVRKISLRSNVYRNWIFFILLNALQLSYGKWDLYEYSLWAAFLYALCVVDIRGNSIKEIALGKCKLLLLLFCGSACAFILIAPFSFFCLKTILNAFRSNVSLSVDYYQFKYILQHLFPNTGRYDSRSYISLFVFGFAVFSLWKPNKLKLFSIILIILYIAFTYPLKLYEIIRLLPLHKGNINVVRTCVLFYLGLAIMFSFGLQEFINERKRKYISIVFIFVVFTFILFYGRRHPLGLWNYLGVLSWLIPLGVYGFCKYLEIRISSILSVIFSIYIGVYSIFFSFVFNYKDTNDGNLQRLEQTFLRSIDSNLFLKLKILTSSRGNNLGFRAVDDDLYHPAFLPLHLIETTNFYSQLAPKQLCEIAINILGNKACYSCIEKNNLNQGNSISAFYSLSSVRYFIFNKEYCKGLIKPNDKSIDLVYTNDEACIFENRNCFDKIRFMQNYVIVGDQDESINYLKNETPWFERNFIVSSFPDIRKSSVESEYSNISYEIRTSLPSYLKIDVSSDKESMMIISNAYDEGWNVNIDGERDKLYRVNAFCQGIKVKPGNHTYVIYYLPEGLFLGILLSVLIVVLLFVFGRFRFMNLF